jgi:hypothetical protein
VHIEERVEAEKCEERERRWRSARRAEKMSLREGEREAGDSDSDSDSDSDR